MNKLELELINQIQTVLHETFDLHDQDANVMIEIPKDNTKGVFNICLNYGGQSEILDAVNKIIKDTKKEVTIEEFEKYLYQELPPIDLMIRTSGEYRLSNFMMYQCSYAEFYFPQIMFPDFNRDEFDKAVEEFNNRNRRFGGN